METKNYEVKILESKGSCSSKLFEKMASKGDITATKVTENIGEVVSISGYALCHITTSDKEFDMNYYATDKGILSSGSQVFAESVKTYFGEVDLFKIISIKTKKGTTYKVSPVLVADDGVISE